MLLSLLLLRPMRIPLPHLLAVIALRRRNLLVSVILYQSIDKEKNWIGQPILFLHQQWISNLQYKLLNERGSSILKNGDIKASVIQDLIVETGCVLGSVYIGHPIKKSGLPRATLFNPFYF